MKRRPGELANREFDVLIIGGGIFGACAAWDAAMRGFSVALIEREDFGGGASANCFKMVHGGIRYLQHADLRRLRGSCHERSAMLRIAPHLVHPLPIVIPTYGHLRQGKLFLGTGMRIFDLLTFDRNRRISDPARHIPGASFFDRRELLELFPDIDSEGLTGGAAFCDGQMHSPTRLVLAFVQSAHDAGATVANYVEATDFIHDRGRIRGVNAKDSIGGEKFEIRAKVTLNAAGPWAEDLLREPNGRHAIDKGVYSRDACFVIDRKFDHPYGLAVQGRTRDPGAVVSREARHLFMVPWQDHTLVGVWHVVWDKSPDAVAVEPEELESFIDEINWAYPEMALRPQDVKMWNAGLVPFGENEAGAVDLRYGKESRIVDHRSESNVDGLVTLIGIRYTMGRADAACAIDLVSQKLGTKPTRPPTDTTPVHGGRISNFAYLVDEAYRDQDFALSRADVETLVHNHGTEYRSVFDLMSTDESLAAPVDSSPILRAEVIHAIREEMAVSLADIVLRRTDMATGAHPGDAALEACTELAAAELGWNSERKLEELQRVRARLRIPRR